MTRLKPKLLLISLFFIVDAGSKALIRICLAPGETRNILGPFLRLHYAQNYRGFSWWVPDLPSWVGTVYSLLLLLICMMAVPVYLFYTEKRRRSVWAAAAFILLTAACLGHWAGDLFLPFTTDFLQAFNSPCANLADLYAFTGIILLLIERIQFLKVRKKQNRMVTLREFSRFVRNRCK